MDGQEEGMVQETAAEETSGKTEETVTAGSAEQSVPKPATPDRTMNAAPECMTQEKIYEELLRCSKKEVFYTRLAAIFTGALFLAVAIALWIVIPQVTATLENANTLLTGANRTLQDIDAMSASLTETSNSLNALVGDNAKTLTDSVQKLSSIDFDGINSAVHDLETAVGPLADAVNKLSSFSLFR
ncbi:MAG: hypothetical protein IKO80_09330 [Lachnospiraceae bacterium]|nr:hypothetical protein [Lachnospiraceae bacterium]